MLRIKYLSVSIVVVGCFVFFVSFCNGASNNGFKYNFSGWDSNHLRSSTISFNLTEDGRISGKQDVRPVCGNTMKLAGGQITFSGYLTSSYPQVTGTFKGFTIFCSGRKEPISGTMKMGYHPHYGVFIQLFSNGTGEEYYFRGAKNPFN